MKDKWNRKNPITKNGHSEKVFVWIIFALPSRWLMLLLLLILRFSRKVPSRFMKSAITAKKIWNEINHLTWSIIWKRFYRVEWDSCKISNGFPFPHCISGMTTGLNESKHLWNVAATNSQLKAMFNSFLVRCECTLKWIGKISSRTISNALKSIVWRPRLVNCETVPGNFFWYPPQYGSPLFGKWRKKALS